MAELPAPPIARLDNAIRFATLLPRGPIEVANPFQLRTERLTLRPLERRDRSEFIRVMKNSREHLARFLPLHHQGETETDVFERQVMYSEAALASDQRLAWRRVAFDDQGRLVGGFNINTIVRSAAEGDHAEIVAWLARGMTGKGYATEGLGALLRVAFDDGPTGLSLDWVFGYVSPKNVPSMKLCRRLGIHRDVGMGTVELDLNGTWTPHWTVKLRPAPRTKGGREGGAR